MAAALLLCIGMAQAAAPVPQENPAVDTLKAKKPVAAPKPAAKAEAAPDSAGTTILGEQDSDVGLYLTPWKEEHADNIDPPPGLFSQAPQDVDPRSFGRSARDAVSVDAYRRQQMDPNR